jgi:hypothetical protein
MALIPWMDDRGVLEEPRRSGGVLRFLRNPPRTTTPEITSGPGSWAATEATTTPLKIQRLVVWAPSVKRSIWYVFVRPFEVATHQIT